MQDAPPKEARLEAPEEGHEEGRVPLVLFFTVQGGEAGEEGADSVVGGEKALEVLRGGGVSVLLFLA
jgi:hypothetical protein